MIRQIVAIDSKRGISKKGQQPWNLPNERRYFIDTVRTHGGNILRGRREYGVLGHVFPGVPNYILTHQTEPIDGATLVHDLEAFLTDFQEDLWVIGGAEVYAQTLAQSDELYVTEIEADFQCDKFYPDYQQDFQLVSRREMPVENNLRYSFCLYKPKN